jgi:hypothetical protein
MSKAERKSIMLETPPLPSGPSFLDGLNIKSNSSRKKPKRTKSDGSPTWHQLHRTYRYYLDDTVYRNVAGIATQLNVESVTSVAENLMDFAFAMYDQGRIPMSSQPNPNPKSNRMSLSWSYANDGSWGRELKPDADRKQRRARKLIGQAEKVPTYGFRWPEDFHLRIKQIAEQYAVPMGSVASRLLGYAVEEWQAGRLTIRTETIVSREVSGWGSK